MTPIRAAAPPVPVPSALSEGLGRSDAGRQWLSRLPALAAEACERWSLDLGDPFPDGRSAWTVPGRRRDAEVVLKIGFPHVEGQGEAAALVQWQGHGAAEVLEHDEDTWALLLRRYRPGHALGEDPGILEGRPEEGLETAAVVLRSLHAVAPDDAVAALSGRLPGLAAGLRERATELGPAVGADPGLVAAAAELLEVLPASAARTVLLHGDLNPGNLLAHDHAGTRSWVVIDPKPEVGDPAYDPWPLLSQLHDPFDQESPTADLRSRTRLVAGLLDVDADRVAAWAFARACESALWRAAELGDRTGARSELAQARVWARLVG